MSWFIENDQAEEEQNEADERWDPDSDMDVDEERYLLFYQKKGRISFYRLFYVFCLLIYLYIQQAITRQSQERNSWSWAKRVGMRNYNYLFIFSEF